MLRALNETSPVFHVFYMVYFLLITTVTVFIVIIFIIIVGLHNSCMQVVLGALTLRGGTRYASCFGIYRKVMDRF